MRHKIIVPAAVMVLGLGNLFAQGQRAGQTPPPAGAGAAGAQAPAQGGRGAGGAGGQRGAQTPKDGAPIDLTGYWVSIVTEDWRYRMVTPAKGDFASLPTNPAGVQVGQQWDPAKDEAAGEQCKSYGAPAIMRVPGRVHVTWDNDTTLKVEMDAGQQTRLFHFGEFKPPAGAATWQGNSAAAWEAAGGRGRGAAPTGGTLKVVTTGIRPGYLRKNGYPYSDKTAVTEYYDRTNEANGDSWLIVTTIVNDPVYLGQEFITSTHFKKQGDATGWNPQPCTAR